MSSRTAILMSASVLLAGTSSMTVAQPRSIYELHQEQSDYVVIAKAIGQKKLLGVNRVPIKVANLEILSVLKGQIPGKNMEVIVQAEAVDLSANCCKLGNIYLMYLIKHNNQFTLIRGRDGIYSLDKLHFGGKGR